MIIGVSGVVEKVGKYPISETWYVSIRVNSHFIQTYAGFVRKPKVCVGDVVKAGDEI